MEESLGTPTSSISKDIPFDAAQKFAYPSFTQSISLIPAMLNVYSASFVVLFWGEIPSSSPSTPLFLYKDQQNNFYL